MLLFAVFAITTKTGTKNSTNESLTINTPSLLKDEMFGYFFFAIRVRYCAILSLSCSCKVEWHSIPKI